MVLEKKKKKLNHLKECRILYEKIFSDRWWAFILTYPFLFIIFLISHQTNPSIT